MESYNTEKEENKAMAMRIQLLPRGCVGTAFIRDMDVCYGAIPVHC